MKTVKKLLICICAGVFSFAALCALTSCNLTGHATCEVLVSDGTKVIFRATQVNGSVSVYNAMECLQKEGRFTFEGYTGDYGFTLTAVNGVENASDFSSYWGVYTDLGELNGVVYSTTDYGFFEYSQTTYAYASYGVSSMPVIEGYTYVLAYTVYEG